MKPGQFVTGIFIALVVAFIYPEAGVPGGWMSPHITSPLATFLIFFIQGIQLKDGAGREVVRAWKLHAACQLSNFVLSPIIFLLMAWLSGYLFEESSLTMGLIFLGMLPTTINSAITMVSMTNGHVPSAILNSSLSNLLGIWLVPLWVNTWLETWGSIELSLTPVFVKLIGLIFLPVVLGRSIRGINGLSHIIPPAHVLKNASMWLIFIIVYMSFCRSVESRVWTGIPPAQLFYVAVLVISGLGMIHGCVWILGKRMKLSDDQKPVFLFCGAQKTIAAGVPLGMALLSQDGHGIDTGLFLIPLMIYHPIQMLVGGHWMKLLNPPTREAGQ